MTKVCTKCGKEKELGEFGRRKDSKDGKQHVCKPCINTQRDAWKRANPEKRRAYANKYAAKHRERNRVRTRALHKRRPDLARRRNLRRDYGITLEEYQKMFTDQAGKCAICGEPESVTAGGQVIMLSVDHNHTTGKIRGLLCKKCNTGIGVLGDSSLQVMRAAMYLAEHGC